MGKNTLKRMAESGGGLASQRTTFAMSYQDRDWVKRHRREWLNQVVAWLFPSTKLLRRSRSLEAQPFVEESSSPLPRAPVLEYKGRSINE